MTDFAARSPMPSFDALPAPHGAAGCVVMGILNVTPDSFSDGGVHADTASAVRHGLALAADGADIVDVGGESTRPGARPVPAAEELARVAPVVRELARSGVRVSIDTMHAEVAQAALDAGACLVNDVSGGLADPRMPGLIASTGVPYVVMHWRAPSSSMHRHAHYQDVVHTVRAELVRRVEELTEQGVHERQLILDPGLGFAKRPEHDWTLLSRLPALTALGLPVLVGASRKTFLTALRGFGSERPARPAARDAATTAVSALAAASGAWGVRVHNVPANRDAVGVGAAWRVRGRTPGTPEAGPQKR